MKPTDFILSLIDASGGNIQGRTLLQKRAYFISIPLELTEALGFDAHYYGPYSAVIDNAVTQLKSLGFVDEANIGFGVARDGFEMKRYDYRLTPDGRQVVDLVKKENPGEYALILGTLAKIADAEYLELSIAAKAYYIIKKSGRGLSRMEIIKEAERFDWKIDPKKLEKAVDFLDELSLLPGQSA